MSHSWSHIEPPPDPPTDRAALAFLVVGVMHLVLAATIDCLQTFNLVLGLVHLALGLLFLRGSATWKKGRTEWWEHVRRTSVPATTSPHAD